MIWFVGAFDALFVAFCATMIVSSRARFAFCDAIDNLRGDS